MSEGDVATAFAPGHVTGFFSVSRRSDPAKTGSRGAGVTLAEGVTTHVTPSDETVIRLNGHELEVESVRGVLDALDVTATVEAETNLPLGAGFGVSGAIALGTAFAANDVFGTAYSETQLITFAHVAEVKANSGLGDVVAQARGGVPIRVEPGAPPHGTLDGIPAVSRIEYVSFGGLSTSDVIGGDTEVLSTAGERTLEEIRQRPTLTNFMQLSRDFAGEVGFTDGEVTEAITAVTSTGGEATMAMLGRTVFALGTGLTDAGYTPETSSINAGGGTLLQK